MAFKDTLQEKLYQYQNLILVDNWTAISITLDSLKMADKLLKFPVLTLVSIFISVSALDQLDKIDVQRLLQRIDKLEENGEAQKAEITLLREKLSSVEQRESALINELQSLKSLLNDESFTTQSVSHGE